MRAEIAEYTQR